MQNTDDQGHVGNVTLYDAVALRLTVDENRTHRGSYFRREFAWGAKPPYRKFAYNSQWQYPHQTKGLVRMLSRETPSET